MALNIDLENLAGGELAEKFEDAMKKVVANMMDPNTPYKNKRKISIFKFDRSKLLYYLCIGSVNALSTDHPLSNLL